MAGPVLAYPAAPSATAADYARLPLAFEENRGQAPQQVRFLVRGPGYSMFLTPAGAVFSFMRKGQDRPAAFRMRLAGSNTAPAISGQNPLSGKMNYYIGRDPAKWHTGIPTYGRVQYQDVYPGVDLIYYGNQRQLEYDFVIAPGADPRIVQMAFDGAGVPSVNARGELVLHIPGGDVYQAKPVAYQEIGGVRRTVVARYVIDRKGQVGLRVGAYDRSQALVIDPYLIYSTYFGGLGVDAGTGIAVDGQGNVYVAGYTNSVVPVPAVYPPPPQAAPAGMNGFVAKLKPDGKSLAWGAYLGGSGTDRALGIALDHAGASVYVTGDTSSSDFPALASTQPAYGGGTDAFLATLTKDGALTYASYLGGSGADSGAAVTVDASGNIYVAGTTESANFHTTANAYQTQRIAGDAGSDGFVAKIAPGGSLAYSTYLGGTGIEVIRALARDSSSGWIYVAGGTLSSDFPVKAFQPSGITCSVGAAPVLQQADAFVAALDLTATGEASLKLSARLGGDGEDIANGIVVNRSYGSAYVYLTGETRSSCVPYSYVSGSLHGGSDAFVTYLIVPDQFESVPVYYWAFVGGSGDDRGTSIVFGDDFQVYLAGETSSCDFPGAATRSPCPYVAFMANIPSALSVTTAYSYLLGPPGLSPFGPAVVMSQPENCTCFGNLYVTGSASENFSTTPDAVQHDYGGGGSDAFVAFLSHVKAVDQSVTTPQGAQLPITLSGLVENCPSCAPWASAPSNTSHGTLTQVWGTNTYNYQPSAGYIGPDQFQFTVSGSRTGAPYTSFPGTVKITVLDRTGPTVGFSLTPSPVFPAVAVGTNLTLSVTASDVGSGDSDIARIEYLFAPYDSSSPQWVLLGQHLGSPQATVTTNITVPSTLGLYTLAVRAFDEAGNLGQSGWPAVWVYDPAISVNGSGTVPGIAGGSAQFNFDFKYAGKANLPSGSLQFQSKSDGVKFKAVDAFWMGWTNEGSVPRWTVQGSGMLDGVTETCGFSLYVTDGNPSPDALGLRIGCSQGYYFPSRAITSGSVTIHTK
ncbi:MAG TPA: SBBP repeat-containing protein [Bryobacteraceae bacterium]|nr:SBBP repeat-containing protein [Bryobacteraceae bacterium]